MSIHDKFSGITYTVKNNWLEEHKGGRQISVKVFSSWMEAKLAWLEIRNVLV